MFSEEILRAAQETYGTPIRNEQARIETMKADSRLKDTYQFDYFSAYS